MTAICTEVLSGDAVVSITSIVGDCVSSPDDAASVYVTRGSTFALIVSV